MVSLGLSPGLSVAFIHSFSAELRVERLFLVLRRVCCLVAHLPASAESWRGSGWTAAGRRGRSCLSASLYSACPSPPSTSASSEQTYRATRHCSRRRDARGGGKMGGSPGLLHFSSPAEEGGEKSSDSAGRHAHYMRHCFYERRSAEGRFSAV